MFGFKSIYIRLLAVLVLAVLGGVYFIYDPAQYGFFPKCPFYSLTGKLCPGCGSQRAIHHLLHLRIADAFAVNPLVPLALPYLGGAVWARTEASHQQAPRLRNFFYGRVAILTVFFLVLGFWIGRNLW